jgi:phenylacetate-CoA ligase
MREFLGRAIGLRLVDRVRRTDSLRLYREYRASQWLSRDELRAIQMTRLRELLIHASEKVPHYRGLFRSLSLDPRSLTLPEDLSALPALGKADIRRDPHALKSEDFERWTPRMKSTSGSTGEPLVYFVDRRSHGSQWANIYRAWNVAGYRPGQKYATLAGGSLVPGKTNRIQAVYTRLMGSFYLPTYHVSDELMERYVALLRRKTPPYLYAYPSAVHLFARYCERRGVEDLRFDAIFTTSEMLLESERERIESVFRTSVFDTYGCNDGGIIAFECAEHSGYHYNMESAFIEIVDERGKPLPPGKPGRVMVTNLVNYAMPFIRYDTGDVAVLENEPCPCGRGLVKLREILGRTRDFVRTADGRYLHGAFFNHLDALYGADWIERWQVYQDRPDRVCLRVIQTREPSPKEIETVEDALRKGLGEGIRVTIEMREELPVTAAGKHKIIVTELDE